jgi:nucleotide-binding universal stress UspA family protein
MRQRFEGVRTTAALTNSLNTSSSSSAPQKESFGLGLGAVELLGVKKSNAEHELSFVEEHLRAQHPKCRSCFRVGTAFEQIVREAESIGADLIVMSSHCYSWLDRILHGSDAERVLSNVGLRMTINPRHEHAPQYFALLPVLLSAFCN